MKELLKNLFTWRGRWNRLKFWIYPWIYTILIIILMIIVVIISEILGISSEILGISNNPIGLVIIGILYFSLFYISIVTYIKRLHDLDKSGWMSLLLFVPFANIYLFVICCFFKGTPGKNRFGDNPLGNSEMKTENGTPDEL